MTFSISSLVMGIIILSADSASAWIVSSTDASVAAATTATVGILKHDPKENDGSLLSNTISHRMYYQNNPSSAPSALQRLPFLFQDLDLKFPPLRNIFVPPPSRNPSSSESKSSSWSHSIQDDSIPCTYYPVWEWQSKYFQQHLTNFREVPLLDPSLALVQNEQATTRVRTKWYASDEYRLIRMTYMDHGGDKTQIFTTVCYPRSTDIPIMGHGLLQVGDRRITISDFQPLQESHAAVAKEYLQPIQEQYPSLTQEMSERFFEQGVYMSDYTLLGRFSATSTDDSDKMWKDLWPAYQACVETHVQLCQAAASSSKGHHDTATNCIHNTHRLLEDHAAYDAHVASSDPAIKMLTGIFGEETATKIVYEALFPLADPPSSSSSRQ